MQEVIEKIRKFNEDRDWDQFHQPVHLAKSIVIEAAELLECFQWSDDYNKEDVCEELADVMNYCIVLADKLGVDIKTIILDKLAKTELKYPVEKAKGVSTKYDKLQSWRDLGLFYILNRNYFIIYIKDFECNVKK